ncbi:MAG: hypothetical protein ACYC97_08905 [Metallibacterium sp.]
MRGVISAVMRIARGLLLCLFTLALAGCSRHEVSGYYVASVGPDRIAMIHLVESPPGHLTGSLVVSSLAANGARNNDLAYDLAGSITGTNISLEAKGGLASIAQFFGNSTTLIGHLRGDSLSLSRGAKRTVYREMSKQRYDSELAKLDHKGQVMAMTQAAVASYNSLEKFGKSVDASLVRYVAWGDPKITQISNVQAWYQARIARYIKCLDTIRPLAAAHIPEWRWQQCVLNINNDKFYRDQETSALRALQAENNSAIAADDSKIEQGRLMALNTLAKLRAGCSNAMNAASCDLMVKKLYKASLQNGMISDQDIASFRAAVPLVNAALAQDLKVANTSQARLDALAEQAQHLYQANM